MDLDKLKLWKSGMTEEERDEVAKHEAVEAKFKLESGTVRSAMSHKGFSIIIDKIVDEMEMCKSRLINCKEKDLKEIQLEIKIRKQFLAKWGVYVD